jgi:hypothetical protein
MKYQLVLQWPVKSLDDYQTLIEIENVLEEKLSDNAEIDGHDYSTTQMNIFIHTNGPKNIFKETIPILASRDFFVDARIAYREQTGKDYVILWPPSLTEFIVK